MRGVCCLFFSSLIAASVVTGVTLAEEPPTPSGRIYAVANAHLDTQWQWTIQDTVLEHLPRTLKDNFALFEKYPDYKFSFEGAWRYMLIKDYYPEDFAVLKQWVKKGNWFPAGAMLENVDPIVPAPESLIRQILYGNGFFEEEFGVRSRDLLTEFSFGAVLPTIGAHCGLLGFCAEKLTMSPARPLPFNIGRWAGPDGAEILAVLNPGGIGNQVKSDWGLAPQTLETAQLLDGKSNYSLGYRYFGRGPRGGAPSTQSVEWLGVASKAGEGAGRHTVIGASSEQLFTEITAEERQMLPRFQGELLMTKFGNACYTSHAEMKRWNRQNEQLADAAERMAVFAAWLGEREYPTHRLRENWVRFLWNQMHDIVPGACIPRAYAFSWNDMILAQQQFAAVFSDSVNAIASVMDTRGEGVPLVVVNALDHSREEVVEATIDFEHAPEGWNAVRVTDHNGKEVPAQLADSAPDPEPKTEIQTPPGADLNVPKPDIGTVKIPVGKLKATVVFVASAPPVGCAIYHVVPFFKQPLDEEEGAQPATELRGSRETIENARYLLRVDSNGDVASVFDKKLNGELLSGPIRLELLGNLSALWPAWEIEYRTVSSPPRARIRGPAVVTLKEAGPARASIEVRRQFGQSLFVQRIRLGAGEASDRVEIETHIDWNERATLLKMDFPLATPSPEATYDLGIGTIARGNNTPSLYEVPAQQWADLTPEGGSRGVSILTDSKYGWDKPENGRIRSTLIHTPGSSTVFPHQRLLDVGRHRMKHALYSHAGSWSTGGTQAQAARFNQPMRVFQTEAHAGRLGPATSFLKLDRSGVAMRALKYHESFANDQKTGATVSAVSAEPPPIPKGEQLSARAEIVIRLQELNGRMEKGVTVGFATPVMAAREVNGAEEKGGDATVRDGKLIVDLKAFQPRTYAVKLSPALGNTSAVTTSTAIPLSYDLDLATGPGEKGALAGIFYIPAKQWPAKVSLDSVDFVFGPAEGKNVMRCRGQKLPVPKFDAPREVHLLGASLSEPSRGSFGVAQKVLNFQFASLSGKIGRWDGFMTNARGNSIGKPFKALFEPREVGWTATHRHDSDGAVEVHLYAHFYKFILPIPAGVENVVLPHDEKIVVAAASVSAGRGRPIAATASLGDSLAFWTDNFDPPPSDTSPPVDPTPERSVPIPQDDLKERK